MAENLVVCIARQFGSGGQAVGQALAAKEGLDYYDKELLHEAAKKSGILQELFEKVDEKPASNLMYSLSALNESTKASSFGDYLSYQPDDQIQKVINDAIRDVADRSSCVIIGRCADHVLRGRRRMLSVFIHADLEMRIKNIARKHNIDEDAARALIRKTDRSRANYYSYHTDRDWGGANNYDLCLDGGRLGIEGTVHLIAEACRVFCPA